MTALPGVPDAQPDAQLDGQIRRWRGYVQRHEVISAADVDELEDHLREQIGDLQEAGLSGDEAFLVAITRIGGLDEVSREFAREHTERLWKQLVLPAGAEGAAGSAQAGRGRELGIVLGLAVGAAIAVKLPMLLDPTGWSDFLARNVAVLVLPFLAGYFGWKRRMTPSAVLRMLVAPFLAGVVLVNAYPFASGGSTELLAAIALPVVLWFAVGLAYVGGAWRSHPRRMDFVRFTGEWVVYYTLLALGGGVLMGLTAAGFDAIGSDAETVLSQWVLPCGAAGAVLVAAWLVEAKQSVVENIAPVLTAVFTPLTTVMLLVYLVAIVASGDLTMADRNLLILADVILVLVLGLLLYAISARDPASRPGTFDRLQVLLVVSALLIDVIMLAAMVGRIAEFGASPNKVAALGLNLILLVNLAWAARLGIRFVRGGPFAAVERWQTTYLPVFAAWAAIVVVAFPPLFGFQ